MRKISISLIIMAVLLMLSSAAVAQDGGSQPVTVGELLLEESFDDPDAWELDEGENAKLSVQGGVYLIDVGPEMTGWGLNETEHTNVIIEVDVAQVTSDLVNSFGVMCRATPVSSDGYYFVISGGGYYSIYAYNDGSVDVLVEWVYSEVIHHDEANRITAVCVDDYFALYVNDEFMVEATDDTYASGFAGLVVSSSESESSTVAFDDLRIWEAELEEAAPPDTTGKDPIIVTTEGRPQQLGNYAAEDWRDAVAELERTGLIAYGGSLIFGEDYAFFDGEGYWFTSMASDRPFADVVMAGELTFTVGNPDEFEVCTLTARIDTNSRGDATSYVGVGFMNDGDLLIVDRFSESEDANISFESLGVDLTQPHHLLFLIQNELATVYVDGELVLEDLEVVDRAGTYGLSLLGNGPSARCEGRNIWVYQASALVAGLCEATTTGNVNRRSGPGTNFDLDGQITVGETPSISGWAIGSDGMRWWQLEDGAWVREDVVNAVGDCRSVPEVTP